MGSLRPRVAATLLLGSLVALALTSCGGDEVTTTTAVTVDTTLPSSTTSALESTVTTGESQEQIGMIESSDGGATWEFKGYAQFNAPDLNPVDPSVLWDGGLLVLYFLDLNSLGQDEAVFYRTVATDDTGLDFTPPEAALRYQGEFTDQDVVRLPGGPFRAFLVSHTAGGIVSATSADGHLFTLDPGAVTSAGSVPGALVLPDGRVRLFVHSAGITSVISDDGLNFSSEPGVRIPIPEGSYMVADADPILTLDGNYLMAYKLREGQTEEPTEDQVYLAESADGFTWTTQPGPLVRGSVPTLVQLPDRRLRIYYVDFPKDD